MSKEEKGNQGAAARKALDAMAKQAATNGAKRKDLLYSFPRVNTTSNREGRGGGNLFSQERVYFLPFFSASFPPSGARKEKKRRKERRGGGKEEQKSVPSPPPGKREGKKRKVSFLLLLPKEERNGAPLPTFFHSEKRQGEAGDSPSPGMDGGGCGAVAGNQYFSLYLGALAVPFYAFFPSLSLSCKNDVSRIFPSRSDTATSLRRHPSPPPKKKSF